MKKTLTVLLFLLAGAFLCGNAGALETYIPHITYGSPDWDDYLQANNNTPAEVSFTLTLYGGGEQVYSEVHTVPAYGHLLIELKSLSRHAELGMIEYDESRLNFRVSYENEGGGVAEFKTVDSLGTAIGLYFSDFTPSVVFKGSAIANLGDSTADVTLYAYGDEAIQGTFSLQIEPKEKVVGVHTTWFPEVDFSMIDSIIAASTSKSLCGIVISSDADLSHLLFTPATPTTLEPVTMIGCGDTLNGAIDNPTATDVYQFNAMKDEKVSIAIENKSELVTFRPCWTLYDPSGNQTGYPLYCETRQIFTLPESGAYLIKVIDQNQDATGTFDLHLEPVSADFNGETNCATPLQCGETIDTTLASKLSFDTYRFGAKEGEAVEIVLENTSDSSNFTPCFTLYDGAGAVVGYSQYCETNQFFKIEDDDIYTIGIKNSNSIGYDSYSIRLEPVSALLDGEASCATPVEFDSTVTGTTESDHASDSYIFDGTKGQKIDIGIVNYSTSDLFLPCFTLYDHSGEIVGYSQYCETTQSFTLTESQQYTVKVHDNNRNGYGEYELSLSTP